MLTGLRHGTVSCGNHQDCAVHLRCAGNHVLDVVSVTGGVYVCVVTLLGLVFHVGNVNGNPAFTFFRSVVYVLERSEIVQFRIGVVQHFGDSRGQGGLAVVNVPNSTNVNVRFSPLVLSLSHLMSSWTRVVIYRLVVKVKVNTQRE